MRRLRTRCRLARLFQDLAAARGDGGYDKLLRSLARTDLLVLDDWGTAPLTGEQRRDLFEVMEDRYDRGLTLIAAQLPVKHWHEAIGDPPLTDAILDRLIHNAYTITLKGESMRKQKAHDSTDLTDANSSGKKTRQLNAPRRYAPASGRLPSELGGAFLRIRVAQSSE